MVVVDAQYVEPYAVDLAVQRKSGSNPNGNFTVVDVHGNLMFKIKDTRFTFHDRHILYDSTDKPVLTFKKKLRSIHGRWQAFKGESTTRKDLLFSVKKSSAPKHETELDVFLVENKEETACDCKVTGDWDTKSCTICAQDGSTILAEVHDTQNITSVALGKDTFGITVYPEVDYVFIVALVVILTEIKSYDGSKKKKKKKMAKKSDSSDDDHKKVEENKDNEKEGKENLDVKSEKEQEEDDYDYDYDYDYNYDYDKDEDEDIKEEVQVEEDEDIKEEVQVEEDDDIDDEDDDDYDDGTYNEEPKYDEYDDDDEDSESSSDEDESPKEK